MHPELVAPVREWIAGLEPDEPLFPRSARKKTYTMVRRDLARAGIPYKTHEGLADFHAAGRHSHITGLIASGASIMEAIVGNTSGFGRRRTSEGFTSCQ